MDKKTVGCGLSRPIGAIALLLSFGSAWANITVNSIILPSAIGRGQDVNITVPWTRQDADPGQTISIPLPTAPAYVTINPPAPPAGCTLQPGSVLECAIPAGASGSTGTVVFQVRGAVLGGFNLTATGTGGSNASGSSDVVSTGDLTVAKTKGSPAGNPLAGQSTQFSLAPNIAAGGDDVASGATLVVTDTLPGTATDFVLASVVPSGPVTPVCSTSGRVITCTYSGPFTAANLNASTITVTGTPLNAGAFTNVGSIASGNNQYFDSNSGNNISNANFSVDPATDLEAQGSFPAASVLVGSAQTLTLRYVNNGPLNAPAGGTVASNIPAGFTLGTLPVGCTSAPGAGGTTDVTCTAGSVANGANAVFAIPLTMPGAPASGNFPITVTPPAGLGDAVPANNVVNVPYSVVAPFSDLRANKSKSPGGPQVSGTVITTNLRVTNDAASPSAATYSPAQPLRLVDYLRPEEVAGGTVTVLTTPKWACTVTTGVVPPAFITANKTTRVECKTTDSGTLAVGGTELMQFSSTLAGSATPISLQNTVCTGVNAISAMGLTPSDGPQPPDSNTANDCANDGAGLVLTPITGSTASVSKLSSVDNSNYFDPVGSAPTLVSDANTLYWRMVVTTPDTATNASQVTIPTLRLTDAIPGRQNTATTGAPAPSFITPAITVTTAPTTFGSCPNLAAGNAGTLTCNFANVPPGTTITVELAVQRPMASGTLTNTATISSPDVVLSATAGGQLSDAAAVVVLPRLDVALTSKSVTPAEPRIGEPVQFTITAQNLGPDNVTAGGQMTVLDNINPTPTLATPGYEVLSVSGVGMNCAASNLATGALSCSNVNPVARYEVFTIVIQARVKKPTGVLPSPNAYTNATNTASVVLAGGYCEYKTETSTNALVSSVCNDANSTSNNAKTATFNIKVPAVDMKQRKGSVLPGAQTVFGLGDPLRYRFRVQANGPSRAENVVMTDRLFPPAGFTLELAGAGAFPRTITPLLINGSPAESGYTLDATKAGSVVCTQAAANADIVCNMSAVLADNFMDAAKEVNFEIAFDVTPTTATGPATFGNRAFVCADETAGYESSGACSDVPATAGNNLASVNDTVFPKNDLEVLSKTTFTPSPADINQPVRFDIKLRNNGPSTGVKMRMIDTLPTGFEWVTAGSTPITAVDAGSTATVSAPLTVSGTVPVNGTDNVCYVSNAILTVTTLVQQQEITCDIGGSFPSGSGDSITVSLFARPKGGLYDGSAAAPYLANRTNSASVFPGKNSAGSDVAIDLVPANNTATSVVQVNNVQLGGRVFLDLNNDGDQNGTTATADQGLGLVTLTLTGTDAYGYPVSRTVTSSNAALGAGSLRGDYVFAHLPPSDASGYTVTETQPSGYGNSLPRPNTARPVRNGTSTGVSGTITATNPVAGLSSQIGGIVLASGANAVQFDFPELQKPSLSGFVYLDADNNALKGGSDTGINGVVMTLIGCSAGPNGVLDTAGPIGAGPAVCNGDDILVSKTVTTSTNGTFGPGYYQFDLEEPGRYSVLEQAPQPTFGGKPTQRGQTTAGSVDLVTSAVGANDGGTRGTANATLANAGGPAGVSQELANTVAVSQLRDIVIANSAAVSVNNNFGEVLPASISGTVYTEKGVLNSNYGVGTDWPFAGVTVTLTGTDDLGQPVNLVAITTPLGTYAFNNLRPGTYKVVKTNPAGIIDEVLGAFPGLDVTNTVRGNRVNDDQIDAIVLVSGTDVKNTNFAVTNGPPPLTAIAAAVYVDRDRNNEADSSELRLQGVEVRLVEGDSCDNGITLETKTTDVYGIVYFLGEFGKDYWLCEKQPNGYANGNANGVVGSNSIRIQNLPLTGSYNNGFGELLGSVSGKVYLDANQNAAADATEPGIAGVSVTLTGVDANGVAISRSTVTNAAGKYRFDDLPASSPAGYAVTEQTQQPNAPGSGAVTINGATTAGTVAGITVGTATPSTTKPSAVSGIVLSLAAESINNDFGEIEVIAPDMVVTKVSSKSAFTEGNKAGYQIQVKNAGRSASTGNYTVIDQLGVAGTVGKTNIESATGTGWTCSISADKQQVSCTSSDVLAAGQTSSSLISLVVSPAAGAALASPLTNTVSIAGGGEPAVSLPQPGELANPPICTAEPSQNACQTSTAVQIAAGLSGSVWLDGGVKKVLDGNDKVLPGWIVDLYDLGAPAAVGKSFTDLVRAGTPLQTAATDARGRYQFCGLEPGTRYQVLFRDPANRIVMPGVVTNEEGRVTGADYYSQVKALEGFEVLQVTLPTAPAGATSASCTITAPEQSLPLDPNGVVYDSKTRQPLPGATVALVPDGVCPGYDPKLHIINYESYAKDAAGNPVMTVGVDGFYKFLLAGDPSTPRSCKFRLDVVSPSGYKPAPSSDIAPGAPFVPPAAPGVFNVQPQNTAPTGTQSTTYYLGLTLGLDVQEVLNNHLPLDPAIPGTLVLSKTGDRKQVSVGDSVLYTIRIRQTAGDAALQTTVRDRLPAGLTFIPGTVRVNGVTGLNPAGGLGPVLAFNVGALATGQEIVLNYRVRVGVGAQQGDGINRARAHSCQTVAGCVSGANLAPTAGATSSNEGVFQVQVSGGVFTDSACVLGKVFVDCNNNHIQDPEELGIPGVRLYMEDGRYVVTDSEGKFSRCNITPQTHVLKADPATLPRGSRLTTTSNRNLGDAGSLILDVKNGEAHRAEFAEGSCTNAVLEQVKARRSQGEIRAIESEPPGGPPLTFKSKPMNYPQQGTDSADQPIVQPRQGGNDAR